MTDETVASIRFDPDMGIHVYQMHCYNCGAKCGVLFIPDSDDPLHLVYCPFCSSRTTFTRKDT